MKDFERIVVLEGKSDKAALSFYFNSNVIIQPSQGKTIALGAANALPSGYEKKVLFIVDCDADDNRSEYISKPNIIVTHNRDLESDFFLYHRSFEALVLNFISNSNEASHISELKKEARFLNEYVIAYVSNFCRIVYIANILGAPTRVLDNRTRRNRSVMVRDLPNLNIHCRNLVLPTFEEQIFSLGILLGWDSNTVANIRNLDHQRSLKLCKIHSNENCNSCFQRLISNGHQLVDLGARVFAYYVRKLPLDYKIDYRSFESNLSGRVQFHNHEWPILRRAQIFEEWSGQSILARPH